MGLDVSHNCWSGSYIAFNRWREEIAKAAGIPLGIMEGHYEGENIQSMLGKPPQWMAEILDKRLFNFLPVKWEVLKPDPIHVLLNHSDCDGVIEIADQIPLAERLEAMAALLPDSPFDMRASANRFAAGLRLAASNSETIEFH